MKEVLIGMLLLESILDMKTKQVWIVPPILIMAAGVIRSISKGEMNLPELAGISVTILILVLVSKGSRESLGMGDVWLIGSMLGVLGILLGMESVLLAFLLSGLYGGIQFICHKSGKKRFPMAPFLLMGTIGGVYMG
ncbi:MAG: prepilin peptidase [Lachnospiraceae bacterium]|nr:prepilin peptidase [Lachnospiraceae bacterium]